MAIKRAVAPKQKPRLHFEKVPLEVVKQVVQPLGKEPNRRPATQRPKSAGR
jgi:hypothetical protein